MIQTSVERRKILISGAMQEILYVRVQPISVSLKSAHTESFSNFHLVLPFQCVVSGFACVRERRNCLKFFIEPF